MRHDSFYFDDVKSLIVVGVLFMVGCIGVVSESTTTTSTLPSTTTTDELETPVVPDGPISSDTARAVKGVLTDLFTTSWDDETVWELVDAGDPRVGWLIADLLRFYQAGPQRDELVDAFVQLTGATPDPSKVDFVWAADFLISEDLPAWKGYPEAKRQVFGMLTPRWNAFFAQDRYIDWRMVTWGGVLPDERPLGDNGPCNCIPGLDYPEATEASGGDWYDDENIVFGVVVNGEALALPKNQMQVHEMVNTTLGGRELGIPYCTLCGSAQAYFVDNVSGVDRVVLRTSGLLQRSNKLMYDLITGSAIDTFTGRALTGPLAEADVNLDQLSVVVATWGEWKQVHPDTKILAEDGGIGRVYSADPLDGRDDDGPIFPVGAVDPRLPIQEPVVGVITEDGSPIAFPVDEAKTALSSGPIEYMGTEVRLEDGIRVYDENGAELVAHESFWFAWSQFHPETVVWSP